jgi:tetratricopeptide (TPR) repeat protein
VDDRAKGLPVDLMQLAWHLAESAVPGDEVAVRVPAVAAAPARTTAPETAASLCGRALLLVPESSAEQATLLALQCPVLARASRPAAAVSPGLAALELLPRGPDRARVATALLSSLLAVGRLDDALRIADDEIRLGDVPPALLAQRALLLVFTGRYDAAAAESERIEVLGGLSAAEGVVVFDQLAMVASMLFQHDKAVEYANRALRFSDGRPAGARGVRVDGCAGRARARRHVAAATGRGAGGRPRVPGRTAGHTGRVGLSRIFGKLHVSSRLELARVLDTMS